MKRRTLEMILAAIVIAACAAVIPDYNTRPKGMEHVYVKPHILAHTVPRWSAAVNLATKSRAVTLFVHVQGDITEAWWDHELTVLHDGDLFKKRYSSPVIPWADRGDYTPYYSWSFRMNLGRGKHVFDVCLLNEQTKKTLDCDRVEITIR